MCNARDTEDIIQKIYEAKAILESLEDIKSGNVVDGKKVFAEIRDKYKI